MCGIFGFVAQSPSRKTDAEEVTARMRDALSHRGPDGWGLVTLDGDTIEEQWSSGPPSQRARHTPGSSVAALGHQRLAIIDLSDGGRQPRASEDGRYWITYNGEIYNYRELRRELESCGQRFVSQSDTEVLLALYVRDGPGCLDRLRGMFAFAVWDDLETRLFLARDRFGMKPLCYTLPGAREIAFGSEPKALLAAGLVSPEPGPGAAARFLRRGSMPADGSWYRDVCVVPPGHWMRWDGNRVSSHAYWSPGEAGSRVPVVSARAAAAALRPTLPGSVSAHMVSDVPVGVFLSGGLDSTAVLAAARDAYDGPLRTFTVTFPGTSLDESALARRAAAQFGTDHVEVHVSGDQFFANIDRFFDVMDEPTIDGANTYIVAQAAHEAGLKVVLSGLGADELLGGYASFVRVPQIRRLVAGLDRVPGGCATAAWVAAHTPDPRGPKMAELLGGPARSLVEIWRSYRALFSRAHLRALVGPDPVESGMADRAETNDWFWDVARLEVEEFMCPQLLRDSDAFTMTWGVELRTPFVDHLVLSAVRDTARWRREGRASYKATLFRHMRGLVPETHLDRPKQGFVLPLEDWLRRALDGSARPDKVLAAVCAKPRYQFAIDLFRRRRLHWSRIWALYVLERFGRGRDEPIPDRAPT